jgi:DNA-binding NarL/FixJ family response regulator
MIKIIIVDDHAIVRSGLINLFKLTADCETVGEASDGNMLLSLLNPENLPDLILLDISMPGANGIEITKQLKMLFPNLIVLILSMHIESQVAAKALKAGANGYITKDSNPEKLLEAIRKVVSTGRYLDPLIAEQLAFNAVMPVSNNSIKLLSQRELEIFHLLSNGISMNNIAQSLNISYKTVTTHKYRLMEKLNIATMKELYQFAMENSDLVINPSP